jgi:hypothetical protein
MVKKRWTALEVLTRLTHWDFIEIPLESYLADGLSVGRDWYSRAVDSMTQLPQADDGVSTDADQNAPNEYARTQCPYEQPGGLSRKILDIDPTLTAMSKDLLLLVLALLLDGLSWSKIH